MNNETLLIAPNPNAVAPTPDEVVGVIGSANTMTTIETKAVDIIGGADGPTAIFTAEVGMANNMAGAVQILGQGMASIFVVLGLIAVVVAGLKKLDSKKK